MKNRRKKRRESGQAMVEFAMVLPFFLLLVMGILDFGWLFYNYISVENSARNAARIACVEYTETCYNDSGQDKGPVFDKNFDPEIVKNSTDDKAYTDQEKHIAEVIDLSIPKSVTIEDISIKYTYDQKVWPNNQTDYRVEKRSEGDVTVTVKGKFTVLTPVLGVFCDHMQKDVSASATYKVETHPNNDDEA